MRRAVFVTSWLLVLSSISVWPHSSYGSIRFRRGVCFGPGVCGPIDATYIRMATETGGQPFPM